jgi:transglutaminase-like putative cysteine protease
MRSLSVALVAAGVVSTVLLRAHHAPGGIGLARGRPPVRVVARAAGVAVVVAVLAGFIGQRLPGASDEPLFETRGSGGDSGTEVSPLVDIRSRLTNQSDAELFVVQANEESYWRSTTLASFDGRTWAVPDRPVDTGNSELASGRSNSVEIRQQVRIVALTGSLVPAAPDPIAASGPSPSNLRYDPGSTTLETQDSDVARGDTFDVVSSAPRFDPTFLASATSLDPTDSIYLELPEDFPNVARELAAEVTAGSTSSYEAAIALQNWFKSEFTYSLEVQPGHGSNAIVGFLRERVGYCEQFAGTYAAMMRSLGIPARVSVGFTTGRSLGGGSFSVEGKNAHAWPEVWFDDVGWVLFEPTPGRGAPGAEAYTGVAPEQDTTIGTNTGDGTPTNAAAPTTAPRTKNGPRDPDAAGGSGTPTPTTIPATITASNPSTPWQVPVLLIVVAVLIAVPALVRRLRRATVSRAPTGQIAGYWERALVSLADVDVKVTAASTPTETAQLAATAFPIVARPIRSLADVVTASTYRPEGVSGFDVQGAYGSSVLTDSAHWTRQIERAVTDSISTSTRIRRYFMRWR